MKITVGIPSRDRPLELAAAILSLDKTKSNGHQVEFIVGHDHNDSRTAEVISQLVAMGLPVLVGLSRKSSIARAAAAGGAIPGPSDRLGASIGGAVTAYLRGAHVLRVHDVKASVQALRVAAALRSASDAGSALQFD
jgi:dihydropteroate synthase